MSIGINKIVPAAGQAHFPRGEPIAAPSVAAETPSYTHSSSRLLTVGEVATILRVHPNRVYELASRRTLPTVRVGRLLRFHLGALQAWIESGGTQNMEVQYAPGRPTGRG